MTDQRYATGGNIKIPGKLPSTTPPNGVLQIIVMLALVLVVVGLPIALMFTSVAQR